MSTKISLKHYLDEAAGGGWFHLYWDCFDEVDQFVGAQAGSYRLKPGRTWQGKA